MLNYFRKNKNIILVILTFIIIASSSLILSSFLPSHINDDEIVLLLVNKAQNDLDYPDRELIMEQDYRAYIYPNILGVLDKILTPNVYRNILLFFYVFFTGIFSYLAFRLLSLSKEVSLTSSVIALLPRMSPGMTFFGVFTHYESLGRSLALPLIWIFSALNLKMLYEKKRIWKFFLLLGFFVYVHPVSMIFFAMLLFLVNFLWLFKASGFKEALKEIILAGFFYFLSASILFGEIILKLLSSSSHNSEISVASGKEYAEALLHRIPWEFFSQSLLWLRHVFVVSFVFIVFIVYVSILVIKNKIQISKFQKLVYFWSISIIACSVILSFVIPSLQLWLVSKYDFPFVIQQSSRIFKFFYLGLFIIFAVSLDIFRKYKKNNLIFITILVVGILSSSIFFEWGKFIIKYKNFQREHVPISLQDNVKKEDYGKEYGDICKNLKDLGVNRDNLVISTDFKLRYYCEISLFVTFEEGGSYFMSGKNGLVKWKDIFYEQRSVLRGDEVDDIFKLAYKIGADYAIIKTDSDLGKKVEEKELFYNEFDEYGIIKF